MGQLYQFAPEDIKIGDKIWDRLDQSIRIHDKVLLILSEQSIGSAWVEDEVTTAFEEERRRGKINGRKRDVPVDTPGLLPAVAVTPTSVQDRDGARLLFSRLGGACKKLRRNGKVGRVILDPGR